MTKSSKKPAPKKKPVSKKKAPPRELNKAEAFYVESHLAKHSEATIAGELGIPVAEVAAYAQQLRDSGWSPAGGGTGANTAGFSVKNGTVSMTGNASETADEFQGAPKKPRNEEFFKRRGGGIHVINPNLPVR